MSRKWKPSRAPWANRFRELYLAGWRAGVASIADPNTAPRSNWTLTYGVAIEPYRMGFRAALNAAWGR
jgi:hypothetical protein